MQGRFIAIDEKNVFKKIRCKKKKLEFYNLKKSNFVKKGDQTVFFVEYCTFLVSYPEIKFSEAR